MNTAAARRSLAFASPPLRASSIPSRTFSISRAVCENTEAKSLSLLESHAFKSCGAQITAENKRFNILFLGSDNFSVATLSSLLESKDIWSRLSIVTSHSRRTRNRRGIPTIGPLAQFAEENSLECSQIPQEGIKSWRIPPLFNTPSPHNLIITSSFGHILPPPPLALFHSHRKLNIHPSLLPRHRGPSPIQYALMNGDEKTGVTVQGLSEKGEDKGEVWLAEEMNVPARSTYGSLEPRLARLGGDLLVQTLRRMMEDETWRPTPQASENSSRAPKITRLHSVLDWEEMSSAEIERRYRALGHQINLQTFFPPTSANLSPTQVSLFALSHPHSPLFPLSTKVPLGHATYHAPSESLLAQTKDGLLQISEVQVAGKRRVSAEEGWRGFRDMGRVMRVRVGIEEEVDVVRFLMGGELDVIREELKAARKKKNSSG